VCDVKNKNETGKTHSDKELCYACEGVREAGQFHRRTCLGRHPHCTLHSIAKAAQIPPSGHAIFTCTAPNSAVRRQCVTSLGSHHIIHTLAISQSRQSWLASGYPSEVCGTRLCVAVRGSDCLHFPHLSLRPIPSSQIQSISAAHALPLVTSSSLSESSFQFCRYF
jgi:hypothetical protein